MRFLLLLGIFSAGFWAICSDTGAWILYAWRHNPFYTHGFIVAGVCCCLVLYNGFRIKKLHFHLLPGLWWCSAGLIMAGAGAWLTFRFFVAAAYFLLSTGIVEAVADKKHAGFVKLPLLLMFLAVPLPFLNEAAGALSFFTAKVSAVILDLCFPSVIVNGIDVFMPPDVRFIIGANCSGANSMLALIIVVVVWLVIVQNRPVVNYTMVLLTIPAGLATNVLRIVVIFIVARMKGMDAAVAVWHDFSGYFFYVVALGILAVSWYLLNKKFNKKLTLRRILIQ